MSLRWWLGTVLLAFAVCASAQVTWSRGQQTAFRDSCVRSCQKNPKVHESRRPDCPAFCDCYLGEVLRQFPNYAQMERVFSGPDSPDKQRFFAIAPVCNQRVFGR